MTWLPAYTLWKREIVRFLRQRNRVVSALLQPLMFWALFGFGFGGAFRMGSDPAEALRSIAAQTHTDHETLLVVHADDPDVAESVRAELPDDAQPPRLQVIAASGGGRSRPLNAGLDAASGDYVCFLDDDDLVTDDWLASFAEAAAGAPGTMIRAITLTQPWTTDGGEQPVRATGPAERTFADRFDLLAHVSHNETPLCSVALPRTAMAAFGIRFDEELPVFDTTVLMLDVAGPLHGLRPVGAGAPENRNR